jgi:serine protease
MFTRNSILLGSLAGAVALVCSNISCGGGGGGFGGDGGPDGPASGASGGSGGTAAGGSAGSGFGGSGFGGSSTGGTGVGGSGTGGTGVGGSGTGGTGVGGSGTGGTGVGGSGTGGTGTGGTGAGGSTPACTFTGSTTGGIAETTPSMSAMGGGDTAASGNSMGGYSFGFSQDTTASCSSLATVCVSTTAFCASGMLGVKSTASPYPCNGAGVGVGVSGSAASLSVPSSSTGITYTLSAAPTSIVPAGGGMRIGVITTSGGASTPYCLDISSMPASGSVPWTMLVQQCYNPTAMQGPALTGPPTDLVNIQFDIDDGTAAGSYSFCVDSLSF